MKKLVRVSFERFPEKSNRLELEQNNRVLFRYVNSEGEADADGNPNGSMANIAGIANARFNVMGMMPHPERAAEKILGSADGRALFESLLLALK